MKHKLIVLILSACVPLLIGSGVSAEVTSSSPSSASTTTQLTSTISSTSQSVPTHTQSTKDALSTTQSSSSTTTQSTKTVKASTITSGIFGTAPWHFDVTDGTLYIDSGILGLSDTNPWSLNPALNISSSPIKKIVFNGPVKTDWDASNLFSGLTNLTEIDNLKYLDTSKATNMSTMFSGCKNLTSLDLSHFNTSNVTNMSVMFADCSSLISLDLSSFDTSNVTDMGFMFTSISRLTSLDLSHFNTSNVTSMYAMFSGCSSLTSLDLSSFNTSKVINMDYMFGNLWGPWGSTYGDKNLSNLTSLDLSSFDTSNVTTMMNMFSGCSNLTSLDLSSFDTSKVTNMINMFSGCSNLTSLDLSHFDTSKIGTDFVYRPIDGRKEARGSMDDMFDDCNNLSKMTLGPLVSFPSDANYHSISWLPSPPSDSTYTGKWINIGEGTSPFGEKVWSAGELQINYKGATDADTYVWQRVDNQYPAANVTINYLDESGKKVHDSQIITGNIGEQYDASSADYQLKISGYTLDSKKLPSNLIGKLEGQTQTINYVYSNKDGIGSSTPPDSSSNTSNPSSTTSSSSNTSKPSSTTSSSSSTKSTTASPATSASTTATPEAKGTSSTSAINSTPVASKSTATLPKTGDSKGAAGLSLLGVLVSLLAA
ncbi:BspA family leucine-rich repeat surface protein, partial [Lactococcus lactis subsp. lactis]|uniref:BspA family leucine-rich repeat surface protein n=1 Tax=Lactococcus lactis TaxID=1358 RepID=UPI00223BB86F